MMDALKIVLTMAAIAALFWGMLELRVRLDLWTERKFGWSLRMSRSVSQRSSKVEIQTLFHGNTKDQDQL